MAGAGAWGAGGCLSKEKGATGWPGGQGGRRVHGRRRRATKQQRRGRRAMVTGRRCRGGSEAPEADDGGATQSMAARRPDLAQGGKDGAGLICWAARRRREPRCGGGGARRRARQRQPQEAEAGGGAGVEAGRREGHRGWPTRGLRGIRRNRSRGLATEEKDEGIGSKQQEGEMAALRGGRGDGTRARLGVRGDRAGLTGRLGQA